MGRERRAYVVLAIISMMLSGLVLLYGINQQKANDHKFCDVFGTLISGTAPLPANPKTDPSRARTYKLYVKFVALDRSLGC